MVTVPMREKNVHTATVTIAHELRAQRADAGAGVENQNTVIGGAHFHARGVATVTRRARSRTGAGASGPPEAYPLS